MSTSAREARREIEVFGAQNIEIIRGMKGNEASRRAQPRPGWDQYPKLLGEGGVWATLCKFYVGSGPNMEACCWLPSCKPRALLLPYSPTESRTANSGIAVRGIGTATKGNRQGHGEVAGATCNFSDLGEFA